ncbi:MAG: hypothetical protein IPJ82_14275 [Lewinellaceae bacterium]|nr:hypothetical protein [Lewinellaceae bacterium]
MFHKKLLEVLCRLSPLEHKRLRLYLESAYFNHERRPGDIVRLYDYIMTYDASDTHPKLAKEAVFSKFFPEKPFYEKEKGPLDTLSSDLFGLVKRYLAQRDWERADAEQKELFSLLRFYREHGLEDRFWHTEAMLRKTQTRKTVRDAEFYFTQFTLEADVAHFYSLFNTFEDDANLKNAHHNLDLYFGIVKMEYLCALQYQQNLSHFPFDPDPQLIQAIWRLPERVPAGDGIMIKTYQVIFGLLQKPDDDPAFLELEALLTQFEDKFPTDKYRDLQAFYRFFWARRYYKSGDEYARQKMFEVYKTHYEKGYFYIEDKITVMALRVLITFALKLGQFDWAKKVLEAHPPERICVTRYPAEAYNLNWGEYYFYKKEYKEAQDSIAYKPFENPQLSIIADVLLIKIYFETDDGLLDYRVKALDQKVRRTKMAPIVKQRYYNFLKKIDKIIKYGPIKSAPKRLKLIDEIKSIPEIIEREWLLEKLK